MKILSTIIQTGPLLFNFESISSNNAVLPAIPSFKIAFKIPMLLEQKVALVLNRLILLILLQFATLLSRALTKPPADLRIAHQAL